MEFTVFRDLASIAFIRCTSPIPGTRIHAEGTAFTPARAIAKCRSEKIEAQFQIAHPLRSTILGIAAHPNAEQSIENAWNETLETLVLEQLTKTPIFYGASFSFFGVKLALGRVEDRFFSIALFDHHGTPTATQAVSKNPLKALLKAWTEVRNLRLYNPTPTDLTSYTKANHILSAVQISNISISAKFRKNAVASKTLNRFQHEDQSHYITYFTKETAA